MSNLEFSLVFFSDVNWFNFPSYKFCKVENICYREKADESFMVAVYGIWVFFIFQHSAKPLHELPPSISKKILNKSY